MRIKTNCLSDRIARMVTLCVVAFAVLLPLPAPALPEAPLVVEIHLEGMVQPISAEYIVGGLQRAEQEKASLVLLTLSTPGGLDTSMREIMEKIIASPVPVCAYVAPSGSRAASAGFYILLSADIAAMAPGTNTGAAHPVFMGGEPDEVMKEKVANDAAAYLRSITAKRGRNSVLAETGVTQSKSFTEQEALDGHLIDLVAPDRAALLSRLDGYQVTRFNGAMQTLHLQGAQVEVILPTTRQSFLSQILDPNVAFILLILGVLGLYVEFTHPGLIFAGVGGGIALVLALFAFSLLPVNWAGAALLILSLVFFALEAKFAAHGTLAAGGVIAMVLGALMLINTRMPGGTITLSTALAVAIPFGLITIFLLRLVIRARQAKIAVGGAGMIGEIGRVEVPLAPEGKVYVHGELWDAVSSAPLAAGTSVRVAAIDGLKLRVEPLSLSRPGSSEPKIESAKGA